jgi:aryl carrier-like protein
MNALDDREKVKLLWEEMFDTDIDDNENFFDRGDSLTALILLASIERETGIRVEFSQLVEAPSITGISSLIKDIRASTAQSA